MTTPNNKLLTVAIENGIISSDDAIAIMRKNKEQEVLKLHHTPITQSSDGRWRTRIKTQYGRKQIAKQSYNEVIDALADFYGKTSQTLTVLYDEWISYVCHHKLKAPGTIKYYRSVWLNHLSAVPFVNKPISQISALDINEWSYDVIDYEGLSEKYYSNIGSVLSQIFDYAVEKKYITENPYKQRNENVIARKFEDNITVSDPLSRVLTEDEEKAMFTTAWDCYIKGYHTVHKLLPLAIMFQFNTGLRVSELCALKHGDVKGRILHVERMYTNSDHRVVPYTKNYNHHREVPLNNYSLMLLETIKKRKQELGISTDGYIFSVNNNPLSYSEVKKSYTKYCKMAGIDQCSSHSARKTFITKLVDDGEWTIGEIAKMCGNSERVIWNNYYSSRVKSLEDKLNKFNEIFQYESPLSQ